MTATPGDVLAFWFGRPGEPGYGETRSAWFQRSDAFDQSIRDQFEATIQQALAGGLDAWHDSRAPVEHALAFILLLDQFTRNIYRETPGMIAGDAQALAVAEQLVAAGRDRLLAPVQRVFVYLPFEHAESLPVQERSLVLFETLRGDEHAGGFVDYAQAHYDIIARFGRFPHRNAWLGRDSTPEEIAFLKQPGSSF